MKKQVSIFWFRRDLRLDDNTALYHALKSEYPVLPIFIFDKNILHDLEDKTDARLNFIHTCIDGMNQSLKDKGTFIKTIYSKPIDAFKELSEEFDIKEVFANEDYEPYALERDDEVKSYLSSKEISFHTFKDQVIFAKDEITKENGEPYLVYTPYSKKWVSQLKVENLQSYTPALMFENWFHSPFEEVLSLEDIGFQASNISISKGDLKKQTLDVYEAERNFPAKDSTSRLGVHLRFGTVSIRQIAKQARNISEVYLKELIWREFYMMILYHFPRVVENNFKSKYDTLQWRNSEEDFQKWKSGQTGFPLVDAGMRQLNETGFMHNRIRMLVASFLTKHLLIDWRWGEAYFAKKLLDYELASNNGNWQWAAGTGVDAQPYFRVFNPHSQIEKFDSDKIYIRKWVNEYGTNSYPKEMVEHKFARERALEAFKKAANS